MVLPQRMACQHWEMLFEIHFGEIKNTFAPEKAVQTLGIVISNSFWRNKKMSLLQRRLPQHGGLLFETHVCEIKNVFAPEKAAPTWGIVI